MAIHFQDKNQNGVPVKLENELSHYRIIPDNGTGLETGKWPTDWVPSVFVASPNQQEQWISSARLSIDKVSCYVSFPSQSKVEEQN